MTERIPCPLCGVAELPVPTHELGAPWTAEQLWWIRRMKSIGCPDAVIGRAFGTNRHNIHAALARDLAQRVTP